MARGDTFTVRVEGLRNFGRELAAADKATAKRLQQANKQAVEGIVDEAQSQYSGHYSVLTGRTRRSIRSLATKDRAQIAFGGNKVPWALGQEFGSSRYTQFEPWTGRAPSGRGSHGRFVYPAAREGADKLVDTYGDIIEQTFGRPFPERF